jgi:hypothetical protein
MPFYRPKSHPVGYFSVNARCLDLSFAEPIEWSEFYGRNWQKHGRWNAPADGLVIVGHSVGCRHAGLTRWDGSPSGRLHSEYGHCQ